MHILVLFQGCKSLNRRHSNLLGFSTRLRSAGLGICESIRETSPNVQLLHELLVLLVEVGENLCSRE